MVVNSQAKMQLMTRCAELMPSGKPAFAEVVKYPMIASQIKEHGRFSMHCVVLMLIRDLCASVNVVRNMTEDQMIEAAAMLLDECGNFRLEDYVMMFTLAKRGDLLKIMDRIDVSVIGEMLDSYWLRRDMAGKQAQEKEVKALDNALNDRNLTLAAPLAEALTAWKEKSAKELEAEQAEKDRIFQEMRDRSIQAFELLQKSRKEHLKSEQP